MNKSLKGLVLTMSMLFLFSACNSEPAAHEPVEDFDGVYNMSEYVTDEYKPALWKIYDINSSNYAYLFGTVHFSYANNSDLPDYVYQALADSKDLYLEISTADFNAHSDAEDQLYCVRPSLQSRMGDEEFSTFKYDVSRRFKCWSGYFNTLKIAAIPSILESLAMQNIKDLKMDGGADTKLEQYAVSNKISCHSIEDIYAHYYAEAPDNLDALFMEIYKDTMVKCMDMPAFTKSIADIYSAWATGNYQKLDMTNNYSDINLSDELKQQLAEYIKISITDRNKVMINSIKTQLSQHSNSFFAVGLAHYAGSTGIMEQLNHAGYRIERV